MRCYKETFIIEIRHIIIQKHYWKRLLYPKSHAQWISLFSSYYPLPVKNKVKNVKWDIIGFSFLSSLQQDQIHLENKICEWEKT